MTDWNYHPPMSRIADALEGILAELKIMNKRVTDVKNDEVTTWET
jgi:hypothetical protein